MPQIIQRGAEAVLYLDKYQGELCLIKERTKKGYRVPELDSRIRAQRTKREARLLTQARRSGIATPRIKEVLPDKIIMEQIIGKRLKDWLNMAPKKTRMAVYQLIGQTIGNLHSAGIIHGDLTTSNMILKKTLTNYELFLIDFGLGKFSSKIEDQAVDLYLLYEALKSTHFKITDEAWQNILKAYKQKYTKASDVLIRIEKIAKRRRYVEKS